MRNIPHRLVCFNTRYPVGGAVHERLCNRWEAEPCWRKYITLVRLRRFIAMSRFLFFVWMGMWSASSCSCWCAFHTMKGYLYPSGARSQNKLSSLSCFYLQCSIIATKKELYICMEWFPWCLPVMSFLIPSAILQPFIPLCRAGDWVQRLSSLFWLAQKSQGLNGIRTQGFCCSLPKPPTWRQVLSRAPSGAERRLWPSKIHWRAFFFFKFEKEI